MSMTGISSTRPSKRCLRSTIWATRVRTLGKSMIRLESLGPSRSSRRDGLGPRLEVWDYTRPTTRQTATAPKSSDSRWKATRQLWFRMSISIPLPMWEILIRTVESNSLNRSSITVRRHQSWRLHRRDSRTRCKVVHANADSRQNQGIQQHARLESYYADDVHTETGKNEMRNCTSLLCNFPLHLRHAEKMGQRSAKHALTKLIHKLWSDL